MDFVDHVVDLGADEVNVTGIASVERISRGMVRVTYFVRRKGEATVAVHLIWDREQWLQMWRVWEEARPAIIDPDFEVDASDRWRRCEAH
jgi:hypothetical protein